MTQTDQELYEKQRKAKQLLSHLWHLRLEYQQRHMKDPAGILLNPDDVDLLLMYQGKSYVFGFGPDLDRILGIPIYRSVDMPSGSVGLLDQLQEDV